MPTPKLVDRPVPGPEAFRKKDWAAILSQAAILLELGQQLHVIRRTVRPWLPATRPHMGVAAPLAAAGAVNAAVVAEHDKFSSPEFPVPILKAPPTSPVQAFAFAPEGAAAPTAETAPPLP